MSEERLFRLGILGSGKGSNAAAIADACAAGTIPARVALVLSDVEKAGILVRARERGLPARQCQLFLFRFHAPWPGPGCHTVCRPCVRMRPRASAPMTAG